MPEAQLTPNNFFVRPVDAIDPMLPTLRTYKDKPGVRTCLRKGVAVGELLCHCVLHLDEQQPETIPGGPVSSRNTSMLSPSLCLFL
jgi:hypothetical protein